MKVISVSMIRRPLPAVIAFLRRMRQRRHTMPPEPLPAPPVVTPVRAAPPKAAYLANSAAHRLPSKPQAMRRSPAMH